MHSRSDRWIVAAMMLANDNKELMYNSVYRTLNQMTKSIILNLFPTSLSPALIQVNMQTD